MYFCLLTPKTDLLVPSLQQQNIYIYNSKEPFTIYLIWMLCKTSLLYAKTLSHYIPLALKSYTMDISCLSCLSLQRQNKIFCRFKICGTLDSCWIKKKKYHSLLLNIEMMKKRVSTFLMWLSVVFFESHVGEKPPPMVLNHASLSMFKNEAHIYRLPFLTE